MLTFSYNVSHYNDIIMYNVGYRMHVKNVGKKYPEGLFLPVNTNGRESEDGHIYRHRLDEIHQVAHESAKDPSMWVEGVGQCEGDARGAHQHVREGQVSYKKVGDVVHLARATNDVEEQVVAEDAH